MRGPLAVAGVGLAGLAQAAAVAWPLGGDGMALPALQALALALALAAVMAAPRAGRAWLLGQVFATAWLLGSFWWLFVSMHRYGGLAAPLAALAVLALASALALYYALALALAWRWRLAPAPWRVVVVAAVWTLAELARGRLFTGFPWGAVGYAWVDALGWLAPYAGVYGMGALAVALSAALAGALGPRPSRGLALCSAVLLAALCWPGSGAALQALLPEHTASAGRLSASLLQGNIPQDEKFDGGSGVADALRWYADELRRPPPADARLIVAPETALPLLPQELNPRDWRDLERALRAGPAAVLLGVPLGDWRQGYTNSAAAWLPRPGDAASTASTASAGPAGPPSEPDFRYDKRHLVPFGEFVPPMFRWFVDLMHIPLGDFQRGDRQQPPLSWAGQRIAPNICYEDLFGEDLAVDFIEPDQSPTVLVNLSNIAWFGDTVAIDQHRQISRLRALELQRPMLRATNTGATAAIDHRGRVLAELPRLSRGRLEVTVEGREGLTPYARWAARWGQWPLALAALAVLLLAWPMQRRRRPG